jgi:hypothetical protein
MPTGTIYSESCYLNPASKGAQGGSGETWSIAAAVGGISIAAGFAAIPGPSGYGYCATFATTAAQCGTANSTNFPVLISVTNSSFATVAHSGYITSTGTQSGGVSVTIPFDLYFSSDAAGANPIPFEFESYNATTGAMVVWVQVPTLYYQFPTVIYCWYGNSSVSTQQNTGSYAPAKVYDTNYKAVIHGSATSIDSTGQVTITTTGSPTTLAGPNGQSGCQFPNPSGGDATPNSYLTLGSGITLSGTFTYSFWIYLTDPNYYNTLLGDNNNNGDVRFGGGSFPCFPYVSGGFSLSSVISQNTWYKMDVVYNANAATVYGNGVSLSTATDSTSYTYLNLGTYYNYGSYIAALDGAFADMRFSNTNRSTSWITAEYNNQKASSTFLSSAYYSITSAGVVYHPYGFGGIIRRGKY